jgi:hypothetical protein
MHRGDCSGCRFKAESVEQSPGDQMALQSWDERGGAGAKKKDEAVSFIPVVFGRNDYTLIVLLF